MSAEGLRPLEGRLNLFQLAMLRWREMHPYNAVHLIRVAEPLDARRLRHAIVLHLQSLGLTGLVLDAERGRYEYTGGPASVDMAIVDADTDALSAISTEIERQLNRPFPRADRIGWALTISAPSVSRKPESNRSGMNLVE